MRRLSFALCAVMVLGVVHAQPQPIDLASLPAEIKSLNWQSVDLSKASPIERCRSLMLMNDVLDELGAQLTAEADLLSDYLDTKELGPEFAGRAPLADPKALTFTDGQKIATALLRGPMAQSSYSTQLAGNSDDALKAYENMYQSTCQWKWSAMADNRLRVRSMTAFLEAKGAIADYRAWVPGEVARRAAEQKTEMAQRQAAAKQQDQEKRIQRQQQLLQQQEQRLQQQQQTTQQMQQALAAAQQSQNQDQTNVQVNTVDGGYPNWYYGGVTGLGVVAAESAWYRNGAYLGGARARTDARYAGWHGGGVRGGRR